jgi:hypothetical protein
MRINHFVNRVFSGKLFHGGLYDDTQDFDKPNFNSGYPWAMVYFRVDQETIIAYGVENARQSPMGLLKKVKELHFEVDYTIKPKLVETEFGIKLAYYVKKVDNHQKTSNSLTFPNLN